MSAIATFRTWLELSSDAQQSGHWKRKAQRWGWADRKYFKIGNGGHLSAGQSSCLYNIEHPPK
jgi:hypothetical protein